MLPLRWKGGRGAEGGDGRIVNILVNRSFLSLINVYVVYACFCYILRTSLWLVSLHLLFRTRRDPSRTHLHLVVPLAKNTHTWKNYIGTSGGRFDLVAFIQKIIDTGVNVNSRDGTGHTALSRFLAEVGLLSLYRWWLYLNIIFSCNTQSKVYPIFLNDFMR